MPQITDPALLSQLADTPSGRVSDPELLAQLNGKPASAKDRVDAAEGGVLSGAAYLATSVPDAVANLYNLGKAGVGYGYSKATGHAPPSWLEAGDPNPIGNWLTQQMDKAELTHTNLTHPEDTASRWLHTAGAAVPGAMAGGGGTVRGSLQALAGGEGGSLAAQGVHEAHPFSNPSAEAIAETLAGSAGAELGGRLVPGAPLQTPQSQAILEGQERGYQFPAATTNPTAFNRLMARMAGGATVQDEAQAHNQHLTNAGVREDLGLPGAGGPSEAEIAKVKREANADYRAIATAPQNIVRDAPMVQALMQARARYTHAGTLSPTLGQGQVPQVLDELMGAQNGQLPRIGTRFSPQEAIDTVASLRDRSRTALRQGEGGDAAAYRAAANAVEGAIDRTLSGNPQTAGLAQAWRAARTRLAQAHSAEDAMRPNGDFDATLFGRMLANGEPLTGNMAIAGRSANAAWRGPSSKSGFSVPQTTPTGGHGGFWGPLTGAVVGGEGAAHIGETIGGLFGHPEAGAVAGAAPLAAYGAYVTSRAAARRLALAQMLARQREAPNVNGALGAAYLGSRNLPGPP